MAKLSITERLNGAARLAYIAYQGFIPGAMVIGPSGMGKSHAINAEVEQIAVEAKLHHGANTFHYAVKGTLSPVNFYCALAEHAEEKMLVTMDDCDHLFPDPQFANVCKSAFESVAPGEPRTVCWDKNSIVLKRRNIDTRIEIKCGIIILANVPLTEYGSKSSIIGAHMKAISSRLYIVNIRPPRFEPIRVDLDIISHVESVAFMKKGVHGRSGLFAARGIPDDEARLLWKWWLMRAKEGVLREPSLRSLALACNLYQAGEQNWQKLSDLSLTLL